MRISIPYYKGVMEADLDAGRVLGAVKARHQEQRTEEQQRQIVAEALREPIESPRLRELAADKQRVLVITSDHTRPMPSAITLPLLLDEIRAGNPQAEIKIIVATGFHRSMTEAEMRQRFGDALFERETILVHDSRDDAGLTRYGTLPSGGELWLNSLVSWADLLVSEGFIEPHFFAGYSGGRKSVLPGISGQATVFYNHNARFLADEHSRVGVLEENPIHRDMEYAAERAGLAFILNVCLNEQKQITYAVAGDRTAAHRKGCEFVRRSTGAKTRTADIVITGNGGYPLDLNIYQSVKCMSGAEAFVRKDGVIIACCSCVDGHGSQGFYDLFKTHGSPRRVMGAILEKAPEDTMADQWQAQVMARVMQKATVILVTDQCDPVLIEDFGLLHAANLQSALALADQRMGRESSVLLLPNGVEIIPL